MGHLGIEPSEVSLVVVSHEHGDYVGGLPVFLDVNPRVTVFVPVAAKRCLNLSQVSPETTIVRVTDVTELCPDIYSTGPLGRRPVEQSLVLDTGQGLVIITGCAHPGVVKIVETVQRHLGKHVAALIGGFHLIGQEPDEIATICANLKKAGVTRVGPCHCSGDRAREHFRKEYGDRYINVGVGKQIRLGALQ
jgi:7,8-dihydropterin-6-yl-methyl-4-(beta-D-ribofuranosyl)aminobenzene 5'-phosphate synthase